LEQEQTIAKFTTTSENDPTPTSAVYLRQLFPSLLNYLFQRMQCCRLNLGTDMWRREFMLLIGSTGRLGRLLCTRGCRRPA
jgi:hypothetical protein